MPARAVANRVPKGFLGELTDILLAQVRGAGARGRRNELAGQVSTLLLRHQGKGELGGAAAIEITSKISRYLDSEASKDDPIRREFGFDPNSGALCWTPSALVRVLGFGDDEESIARGVQRLASWRFRSDGPPFVKLGTEKSSPILYPIASSLDWFEAHKEKTEQLFPRPDAEGEAA